MQQLRDQVREFVEARDWEQFHSPKNLAMALSVEVGEIVEHFQWLTQEQSQALPPEKLEQVGLEIGDVMIYLVRLCDRLGIDPVEQAHKKLAINIAKYPADRVRGKSLKYDEYTDDE